MGNPLDKSIQDLDRWLSAMSFNKYVCDVICDGTPVRGLSRDPEPPGGRYERSRRTRKALIRKKRRNEMDLGVDGGGVDLGRGEGNTERRESLQGVNCIRNNTSLHDVRISLPSDRRFAQRMLSVCLAYAYPPSAKAFTCENRHTQTQTHIHLRTPPHTHTHLDRSKVWTSLETSNQN